MAAVQVFHTPVRLMPITVSHTLGGHLVPSLDGAHAGVGHGDVETVRGRPTPSATASARPPASRTSTAAVTIRPPVASTSRAVVARSSGVAVS